MCEEEIEAKRNRVTRIRMILAEFPIGLKDLALSLDTPLEIRIILTM